MFMNCVYKHKLGSRILSFSYLSIKHYVERVYNYMLNNESAYLTRYFNSVYFNQTYLWRFYIFSLVYGYL